MSISNPPECPVANLLREGKKTVEGRVYDEKRRKIKEGDYIDFSVQGTKFRVQVQYLRLYPTLEDYLRGEGVERCLPGISDFNEAVRLYNTGGQSNVPWADPKKREEARLATGYGMVAIGVKIV